MGNTSTIRNMGKAPLIVNILTDEGGKDVQQRSLAPGESVNNVTLAHPDNRVEQAWIKDGRLSVSSTKEARAAQEENADRAQDVETQRAETARRTVEQAGDQEQTGRRKRASARKRRNRQE